MKNKLYISLIYNIIIIPINIFLLGSYAVNSSKSIILSIFVTIILGFVFFNLLGLKYLKREKFLFVFFYGAILLICLILYSICIYLLFQNIGKEFLP